MTNSEDLLLEIANSMSKDFADPVEHANWCVDVAKKYFSDKRSSDDADVASEAGGWKNHLTEADITRIIRDVWISGHHIDGMLPEAAARAIMASAGTGRDTLIETLEFYANNMIDGGSKARRALEKGKGLIDGGQGKFGKL